MSCVASYLSWNEETKAPVQVLYYHHHLWIIWWSQPLDFTAERSKGWHLQMSADLPGMDAPGNRLQLAQVVCWWKSAFNHLLASTHLGNVTWNLHPRQGWKEHEKTGISLETCHCSFKWRTALKKESKVGPQPWISTSGVGTSFLKVLGPKKPGYGMGNNYIKLEQYLILYWVCSPVDK